MKYNTLKQFFLMAFSSLAVIVFPLIAVTGCTSFVTTLSESKDGTRTTHTSIRTFFDAQGALAKSRTSNSDKSQTTGVGSYNADSSGSNAVLIIQAASEAFAKGLVEGAK